MITTKKDDTDMERSRRIYENNLKSLSIHHPDLFERVKQTSRPEWIHFHQKEHWYSGVFNMEGDRTLTLFADADPEVVCKSFCEATDFQVGETTFLFGLGMGYLLKEIHRRKPASHKIFVIEKLFDLFVSILHVMDMTEILSDPHVFFFFDREVGNERFRSLLTSNAVGYASHFAIGYSACLDEDYYDEMKTKARNLLEDLTSEIGFIKNLGPRVTLNVVRNMRHVIYSASATALKGRFSGIPAVAVGAGPSLSKNVRHLKDAEGKGLIICCDTSLAMLSSLGVTPHFVVTLDYREENFDKFRNVPFPHETALVYNSQVYPENLTTALGPHFVIGCSYQTQLWLEQMLGWEESYPALSNVGKMAYDLAEHMGCSPIVLIGMDHALAETRAHAPMAYDESLEDYKKNVTIDYLQQRDIYGRDTWTTTHLVQDNRGLSDLIEKRNTLVINATEGGLPIRGTRVMRFADAVMEYFGHPLERDLFEEVTRYHEAWPRQQLEKLLETFILFRESMGYVVEQCGRIVPEILSLKELLKEEGPELSTPFRVKMNLLSGLTKASLSRKWREATDVIQQAVLEAHLVKRDYLYVKDSQHTPKERVQAELEAAWKIYGSVQKAAEAFLPEWDILITWIREVHRIESSLPADEGTGGSEALRKLTELGCARQAFRRLKAASTAVPTTREELEILLDIYDRCGDSRAYLDLYRRYSSRFAPTDSYEKKIRTHEERLETWEDIRAKVLRGLDPEAEVRSPWLEMAQFYFRVKEYEIAREVIQTALGHEPRDPEMLFLHAALCEIDGDHMEALQTLENVVALAPNMRKAYHLLALLASRLDDLDTTERLLNLAQVA